MRHLEHSADDSLVLRLDQGALMHGDWDALVMSGPPEWAFMCRTWIAAALTNLECGAPYLITARDSGADLVGVAPFCISTGPEGLVLDIVGSKDMFDYCDIPVLPERAAAFACCLMEFLTNGTLPAWSSIRLDYLPGIDGFHRALIKWANEHQMAARLETQEVCPFIQLPISAGDWHAVLSASQRANMRRKLRQSELRGWQFQVLSGTELDSATVGEFLELFARSSIDKAALAHMPGVARFLQQVILTPSPTLCPELAVLRDGERITAALLQFSAGNRMMYYNSARDIGIAHGSPGTVLLARSIENAIARGYTYYDLLRGSEPYKYSLGAGDRTLSRLTIARTRKYA